MNQLITTRTVSVVRVAGWSGLAIGAVLLALRSGRPSPEAMVESIGVRLITRAVDTPGGARGRIPIEIYLPPRGVVWNSDSNSTSESGSSAKLGRSPAKTELPADSATERNRKNAPISAGVSRRRAAIIAIHGGSWVGGSPRLCRLNSESTVPRLARAGLVVVVPNYPLARPDHPSWPAVLEELREVVRWVRRHADEFEIDPGRIAAFGQSAGGHLAALLGMLPDKLERDAVSAHVDAVIDFYGPSDLARLIETRRLDHDPVWMLLGRSTTVGAKLVRDASPIEHVSADAAPMLLVHGSDDAWVPPEQSVRLAQALARAGACQKLILVAGARHGFEAGVKTIPERDLLPEILDFLRTVWH